jgi:hypothetical protein
MCFILQPAVREASSRGRAVIGFSSYPVESFFRGAHGVVIAQSANLHAAGGAAC